VFYVTPGINADRMVANNGRLCKLQDEPVKTERNTAPLGDNRNRIIYKVGASTFPILFKGKANPVVSVLAKAAGKNQVRPIPDAKATNSHT
jgi:hypothetical protein